jgi:hypothetical protein
MQAKNKAPWSISCFSGECLDYSGLFGMKKSPCGYDVTGATHYKGDPELLDHFHNTNTHA